MYCPRCDETFSSFQSLCPNCFAELRPGSAKGRPSSPAKEPGLPEPHSGLDLVTSMIPQMPAVEFPDLTGAVLDKPREAVQQVAEKAATRVSKAASRLTRPVAPPADLDLRPTADPLGQAALQEARQEIQAALEEAARELQALAGSGREAVMAELHSEGEESRQRAAEALRASRIHIERQMAPHLDRIRRRYASIATGLDPGSREAIAERLQFLRKQASEALAGLERQIGHVPEPVRGVARRLQDGAVPEVPLVDLNQTGAQSVEGLKGGCLGVLGVFLSFILPGLGQFVIGHVGAGIILVFLYIVLKSALPDATGLGWLLSGLAAWHVWTATRS